MLASTTTTRQVEFRIDLIPGAALVVKYTYRLAPSEMQELSSQLQELLDKGFIRPIFSPLGSTSAICKKEGQMLQNVYRFSRVEQTNHQESISIPKD